jgi:hypothetical protein
MKPSFSLILPINKKVNAFSDIFSLSSLLELNKLNEIVDVAVLIAAQGKFDVEARERAHLLIDSVGMEARIIAVPEENPCRMAYLRQTAALLKPESDFYMFVDDDFEFVNGSAAKYAAALDYLLDNDTCGVVGSYGHFGSVSYGDEIRPDAIGKIAATAKGLILRNVFEGHLFPDEVLAMPGPMEEMAAIIWLNIHGYYYAKQFKIPTKNKGKTKRVSNEVHEGDNQLHSADLAAKHIRAWIRKVTNRPYYLYGDPILNLGMGFKPKGKQ